MGKRKNLTDDIVEAINEDITVQVNKTIISGSTLLNLVLGGGYATGKVVNIVGDKSSGKTLFAIECIAANQNILKDNLKKFYNDCESGFSFDEENMYGIQIIEEDQINSSTIEEMKFDLESRLNDIKEDENLIYVVDSFDGLSCEAELEREEEERKAREKGKTYNKGTYGMEKQKYLKKFFRLLAGKIKDKNCTLMIISQVIANIGVMFGEKFTRAGGKALDFYSSQIVWLSEVEKIKKKDSIVGIRVKVKCKKNKIGKPFRECFVDILFDLGIDDVSSNINYLYDLLTPTGKYSPKKIIWEEKEYTPFGLIKHIEENNLEEELKKKVISKWKQIEFECSSHDRKRKW